MNSYTMLMPPVSLAPTTMLIDGDRVVNAFKERSYQAFLGMREETHDHDETD